MTKLPQTQLSTLLRANTLRRDAELNSTDLCSCSDIWKLCENMQDNDGDDDGGDDDDGDDDDDGNDDDDED